LLDYERLANTGDLIERDRKRVTRLDEDVRVVARPDNQAFPGRRSLVAGHDELARVSQVARPDREPRVEPVVARAEGVE